MGLYGAPVKMGDHYKTFATIFVAQMILVLLIKIYLTAPGLPGARSLLFFEDIA